MRKGTGERGELSSGCSRDDKKNSKRRRYVCVYTQSSTTHPVCVCVHVCVAHTHAHTHTHARTYTHTHTHTTQERSVQADAGGLLGEVRRKLSDVQHCLKLVTILKELREHKRETHKKSGVLLTLPLLLYFTCSIHGVGHCGVGHCGVGHCGCTSTYIHVVYM